VLVPPPAGAWGWMAGGEGRRRIPVHSATAAIRDARVASARTGVRPGGL